MKYKYLLFDLDGTLIDTNKLILDSFKYTYKTHLNTDVEDSEILKYFGEPLIVTLQRACSQKAEDMFNTYISYNEVKHDNCVTIFPGIGDLLRALWEKGFKIALVTSKRRKIAMQGLDLFGLTGYFSAFVTLEDTEIHKPNPEPVLKALALLGAESAEALMVGDSIFDIQCAHGAGVKAVLVKWSAADGFQDEAEEADYVVHSAAELASIVEGE